MCSTVHITAISSSRDPPFTPRPSLLVVCRFLIQDCVKRYPGELCPVCRDTVMLHDPEVKSLKLKMNSRNFAL